MKQIIKAVTPSQVLLDGALHDREQSCFQKRHGYKIKGSLNLSTVIIFQVSRYELLPVCTPCFLPRAAQAALLPEVAGGLRLKQKRVLVLTENRLKSSPHSMAVHLSLVVLNKPFR